MALNRSIIPQPRPLWPFVAPDRVDAGVRPAEAEGSNDFRAVQVAGGFPAIRGFAGRRRSRPRNDAVTRSASSSAA
jgi:hypothetical protein